MPLFFFTGATAAKSYGLYIDGLDVLKEPATPARYGVSVDTITVSEAGSGGVSSMSFEIDDPSLLITIADGATIRYWDLTNNLPIFLGFLERVSIRPDFGQQGRVIGVAAYGIEAILDEVIVPSMTFPGIANGTDGAGGLGYMSNGRFLQVVAGLTGLDTGMAPEASPLSTVNTPIDAHKIESIFVIATPLVIAGQSVRQAFDSFMSVAQNFADEGGAPPEALWLSRGPFFLSVDFWGGVRHFPFGGTFGSTYLPSDYATLTISDTPSGAVAAEDISWEQDHSPGAITNAVYVSGAAAASTGWVVGDTTTGRHEAYATTVGSTFSDKLAAANAILGQQGTPAGRGSFTLTDYTPTNVHPGSQVVITDARVGFSAKSCLVTGIRKTFHENGKQNWTVDFIDGVDTPTAGWASAMNLARTYTRSTAR